MIAEKRSLQEYMEIKIIKTALDEIQAFRDLFLLENRFQFVCNKCHEYGWADTYLFLADGERIGYGSVWGTDRREDRDTIFEFFLTGPFREFCNLVFPEFCKVSNTAFVEAQSNDPQLSAMLYEYCRDINAEAILFEDCFETTYTIPGVIFRPRQVSDDMGNDDSEYVLESDGRIVASGGLMLNYNLPYADLYMQVKEPFRRQGLGKLVVQELKKEAYRRERVPAARCNINNTISKATLLKAGFKIGGFRLKGIIKK